MPDYRESDVQGTSFRRAFAVHLSNPREHLKSIVFEEEDVIQLADRALVSVSGNVSTIFDPSERFALIDPATGNPTGATASHLEVYAVLASLYLHLATKRDAAVAAAAAQPIAAVPAGGSAALPTAFGSAPAPIAAS